MPNYKYAQDVNSKKEGPNDVLFTLPVPMSISLLADMLEEVQHNDSDQGDVLERAILELEERCHDAELTERLATKFIAILCDAYKDDPTWDPLSLFPGGKLPVQKGGKS